LHINIKRRQLSTLNKKNTFFFVYLKLVAIFATVILTENQTIMVNLSENTRNISISSTGEYRGWHDSCRERERERERESTL
jgi:hypothetical protein